MSNILIPKQPARTAGQLPITTLWLGYSAEPGDAPRKLAEADGFTAPEVAASWIPYPAEWLPGDVQVVPEWAALITAVLSLFPHARLHLGADDGTTVAWSGGIVASAQSAYECVVSGVLDDGWRTGAYKVTAMLTALVSAGTEQYPTTGYTAAVGTDGAWSLVLPRGVTAAFRFPNERAALARTIPDQASASWGDLAAPI